MNRERQPLKLMSLSDVFSYLFSEADLQLIRSREKSSDGPAPLWLQQLFLIHLLQNVNPIEFYPTIEDLREHFSEMGIQCPW